MAWDNFFDDFFVVSMTDQEQSRRLRELSREMERQRQRASESRQDNSAVRRDLAAEIDVLHYNLSRTLLLLHGLTTTLLRKHLISSEELQTMIAELDVRDGQADGALDPSAVPGLVPRPAERQSTAMALDDLARQMPANPDTPRDFLKQMEQREQ
jgi:hypothetical protein